MEGVDKKEGKEGHDIGIPDKVAVFNDDW